MIFKEQITYIWNNKNKNKKNKNNPRTLLLKKKNCKNNINKYQTQKTCKGFLNNQKKTCKGFLKIKKCKLNKYW